jgi:hypothetical protein
VSDRSNSREKRGWFGCMEEKGRLDSIEVRARLKSMELKEADET